jgi:hypothetical protein
VGQRLEVRLGARLVAIYDGPTLVTTHARRTHGRATRLEHYPPAGQAFLRGTPQVCLQQAQAVGPATGRLGQRLLAPYTLTRLREVQALLRLREEYPPERLERACQRALVLGDGRYRTVQGILARALDTLPLEPETAEEVEAEAAAAAGPANRQTVEAALGRWAEEVLAALPPVPPQEEARALDGKTLRGSRKQGAPGTHLLSALAHRLGLPVAQAAVDDKTNEIGAVQAVLDTLILAGWVVTVDALLTQRAVAQAIVDGGGA